MSGRKRRTSARQFLDDVSVSEPLRSRLTVDCPIPDALAISVSVIFDVSRIAIINCFGVLCKYSMPPIMRIRLFIVKRKSLCIYALIAEL